MTTEIEARTPLTSVFKSPEAIQTDIKTFRSAIVSVLDAKNDIVLIQGTPFIKKSGWNALNLYFGIQTKVMKNNRTELPDGEFAWTVIIECTKEGYHTQRSASCTSLEQKAKHNGNTYNRIEADCYAMAETRAVGRASAAFFGVGDVSAEELGESAQINTKNGTVPKNDTPVEWCTCKEPHPKFEKDEHNLHTCYECKKPVQPATAEKLLNIGNGPKVSENYKH